MPATKAKPQRTLKVLSSLTARVLVVQVTEGRRVDDYSVSSGDGAVWVSHTADPTRRYRVHCTGGGPVSCDCPAGYYGRECRHLSMSRVLARRGELDLPDAECDDRETVEDVRETADERDFWYAAGTPTFEPLGA